RLALHPAGVQPEWHILLHIAELVGKAVGRLFGQFVLIIVNFNKNLVGKLRSLHLNSEGKVVELHDAEILLVEQEAIGRGAFKFLPNVDEAVGTIGDQAGRHEEDQEQEQERRKGVFEVFAIIRKVDGIFERYELD